MGWHVKPMDRVLLHRAARRYAAHGWDVVPGTVFDGTRHRCDALGCPTVDCHPARAGWEQTATHDPHLVAGWWREPRAVLLATGRSLDVVEVPAHLGALVARGTVRGPVAVSGTGRWLMLVRPGEPLRPELDSRDDVVLHQRGSWIPVPPSREICGRVRWEVSPVVAEWRLPDSYAVQRLLVDALLAIAPQRTPRPTVRTLVPRAYRAA